MSLHPKSDQYPDLAIGTLVKADIIGYDDVNSDARYVHSTRHISGPLWKQEVEELGYWQYGVQRSPAPGQTSGGVVMVDPDTITVIGTKRALRSAT